jgi:hypothetical protein
MPDDLALPLAALGLPTAIATTVTVAVTVAVAVADPLPATPAVLG